MKRIANTGLKRSQLADAMRKKKLVRLSRRYEDTAIRGYVLDIGPVFFLFALVSDRIWFDGFECFRIADIGTVKPDPYATFAERALKLRGERVPKKPRVILADLENLLLSAGRAFPLITVHREKLDPDVCSIGRVLGINRGQMSFLEIAPDATWDEEPRQFKLSEITRVNFDGDYEKALDLVGGVPAAG
ncbi:MAG: hypothetical protein ACRD4P_14425 [Bryobacteraceae bacterium]